MSVGGPEDNPLLGGLVGLSFTAMGLLQKVDTKPAQQEEKSLRQRPEEMRCQLAGVLSQCSQEGHA